MPEALTGGTVPETLS
jgi:hypothetical protein